MTTQHICLRMCLNQLSYPPPLGCGINKHAQEVMRDLGISYRKAIPQSIADQWWFMGCSNIPDRLPSYLTFMTEQQCLPWRLEDQP